LSIVFVRKLSKILLFVVITCCFAAGCAHASVVQNQKPKRILVILFNHVGVPWVKLVRESLARNLSAETIFPVDLNVEYLDRLRYPEDAYLQKILEIYRYKYTKNPLDLVIGIGDDPTDFLVQYGEELFGRIPLITVSTSSVVQDQNSLNPNLTSLVFGVDIKGNVALIEKVLPETQRLFIVSGSSTVNIGARRMAQAALKNYSGPFNIDYIHDLTEEEFLEEVSRLPDHSALLYLTVSRDSAGKTFVPRELLSRMAKKANAPIFGIVSTYLGHGIVGGNLLSAEILGRRCAQAALQLLKGEIPRDKDAAPLFSHMMFDWRQMERWAIPEEVLPSGSSIHFKPVSAWDSYRWYIISVISIISIQSFFLFWLLRQRRQILQTKAKLKRQLRFEEMLSQLSSDFIKLQAGQLHLQIEQKLEEIGELLEVDRVSIFKLSEKNEILEKYQSVSAVGVSAPPPEIDIGRLPWLKNKLIEQETVIVSDLKELPDNARQEKEYLDSLGIRSVLVMPLVENTASRGILSLAMVRQSRDWNEGHRRYALISEIIANALARQQYITALQQSKDFTRSILDSMFNHIAVLDHDGTILDVNDSWQRYTLENDAIVSERTGIGANYLEVCRLSTAGGDQLAQAALDGIQSVLDRTSEHFTLEYPCHSPKSQGWFLMKVVPFTGRKNGVIVSHSDISARKTAEIELREAYENIEQLKNKLELESNYLKEQIKIEHSYKTIVGSSDALKNLLYKVEKVAAADTAVLILGETGTGKELIAQVIHDLSPRKERPLIKVNCAALPKDLIESELFGHEKGAFTGAYQRKVGRFELADNGTIFLDEIGDLPIDLQAKLLRVLQEGEFERIGNSNTCKVDIRIIAATNRDLEQMVSAGTFRQDLYYRLNVYPVICPPLREREGDIPILVKHFIDKYSKKSGSKIIKVPKKVYDTLEAYTWPGNIRELENIIERALVVSSGSVLELGDWFPKNMVQVSAEPVRTLKELERKHIIDVLELTSWRVSGAGGAAEKLGLKPTTLEARMKKMGISRKKR